MMTTPKDSVPTAEIDPELLALLGEPIRAFPEIWTLQQWWEYHARLTRYCIGSPGRQSA